MTKTNLKKITCHPANALRAEAWRDLPKNGAAACYKITIEDSGVSVITLAKGNSIILDALLKQPVFCASPRVCEVRT
jgi:hypothetical protein